jgi:hypothetical protein
MADIRAGWEERSVSLREKGRMRGYMTPLTPTLSRREREKQPPWYFTGMYAVVFQCLNKCH